MTHIFLGAAVQPKGVCRRFNYPQTPTQSSRKSVMCRLQLHEIITPPLDSSETSAMSTRAAPCWRFEARNSHALVSQRLPRDLLADTRGRVLAPGWRGGSVANSLCSTCLYLHRFICLYCTMHSAKGLKSQPFLQIFSPFAMLNEFFTVTL
jgi:hypothetical protein